MSSGLWRGHRGRKGIPQTAELTTMLRAARDRGNALHLWEIMAAGIAQHGARFNELRSRGFVIENEMHRGHYGLVHSQYYLRHDPERDGEAQ